MAHTYTWFSKKATQLGSYGFLTAIVGAHDELDFALHGGLIWVERW